MFGFSAQETAIANSERIEKSNEWFFIITGKDRPFLERLYTAKGVVRLPACDSNGGCRSTICGVKPLLTLIFHAKIGSTTFPERRLIGSGGLEI